jgi:hypothetical protein
LRPVEAARMWRLSWSRAWMLLSDFISIQLNEHRNKRDPGMKWLKICNCTLTLSRRGEQHRKP